MITTEIALTSNSSLLEGATSLKPRWYKSQEKQAVPINTLILWLLLSSISKTTICWSRYFPILPFCSCPPWKRGRLGLQAFGRSGEVESKLEWSSRQPSWLGYLVGGKLESRQGHKNKKNILTTPCWGRAQSALLEKARTDTTPKIPWRCINITTRTSW